MAPSLVPGARGEGLSPLLQHPAMLIHPPIVFLGYAAWGIPFALAAAAMISGRLDNAWLQQARPWSLFAWATLGGGILWGAEWAYEQLGSRDVLTVYAWSRANGLVQDALDPTVFERLKSEASAAGAEEVVGIKTYIVELGSGLVEVVAIGTAVRKIPGMGVQTSPLPAQAIIRDKDTWVSGEGGFELQATRAGA